MCGPSAQNKYELGTKKWQKSAKLLTALLCRAVGTHFFLNQQMIHDGRDGVLFCPSTFYVRRRRHHSQIRVHTPNMAAPLSANHGALRPMTMTSSSSHVTRSTLTLTPRQRPPAPRRARAHPVVVVVAAAAGGECTLDDATLKSAKLIYATSPAMDHMREGHPESNARVPAILDALAEARLTPHERQGELVFLEGYRAATAEEVMTVHTKNYVNGLNMLARTRAPLDIDSAPTYVTSSTYEAAVNGIGAAISLVDAVVAAAKAREGTSTPGPAGFGLCRPPVGMGHSIPLSSTALHSTPFRSSPPLSTALLSPGLRSLSGRTDNARRALQYLPAYPSSVGVVLRVLVRFC